MLKEKTGIGPGLLFMVLFASIFGYGIMQSAYVAAEYMGNNGYLGFILAFILALGLIYILNRLGRRFPNKSIIQYLPEVFGRIVGKILGFTYLAFIMGVLFINSSLIVQQNKTFFLAITPSWAVILLFLSISAFIAYQGIEGITRLAGFVFPVTFVLCLVAIAFSFQSFELDNIRPIFFIDGLKIPLGTLQIFYPFVGLITILMLYPYLSEKQKILKASAGAATLAFLMILALMISAIGNYSATGILRYNWTAIEITRKASLPYVLQTFGLFFTVSWLTLTYVSTGLFYYVLAEGATQLVNKLNYKWMVIILFPIIYLSILIISSGTIQLHTVSPYYRYLSFGITLMLPLFIWFMAVIRKRGVKR